jgi:hypothetical protein
VTKDLGVAVEEAEKFVDRILAEVDTAALGAKS